MRDSKYEIENGEIVNRKTGVSIPKDEPLLLLRARDILAISTLKHYLKLSKDQGCTSYHIEGVKKVIRIFQSFKRRHPERMKEPGISQGR